jgi:hypothetical protein
MHLKVFLKLKKPKKLSSGQVYKKNEKKPKKPKKPKKTKTKQKNQKNKKKTTGLGLKKKKPGFFQP